jgi:hypothetical protein
MKFQQLPIGGRFEFEGKVYVKTGPVTATSEQGGQRMIPRYATLRPLDGTIAAAPPAPQRKLDEAQVLAAFEAFCGECERVLAGVAAHGLPLAEARDGLSLARQQFLAAMRDTGRSA